MVTEIYSNRTVFVSYAINDQGRHCWLERLKLQLEPLLHKYQFDLWDDGKIELGKNWLHEIEKALDRAAVAVLLVGPAFLGSKFITEIELPRLLRRGQEEGMALLILITNHCNFQESDLASFQAFKEKNKPLIPLEALEPPDQNRLLQAFSIAIKEAVEKQTPHRSEDVCKRTPVVQRPSLLDPVVSPEGLRHNLPVKPIHVIGRDRERKALLAALEEQDKPVILLSGFGGVGKSTVAKVVAWNCVERKQPFNFIAWIDVRQYGQDVHAEPITFGFVLDSIAKVANPVSEITAIGDMEIKANRVRELLGTTRSLLILDNYESLLAKPSEEERVARFVNSLPIGPSGGEHSPFIRVLITTRVVSPTLAGLPIYNKRLESLPFRDSLRMMKSQPDAPGLTQQQWRCVWKILQGLPKYMQIAVEQLKVMTFSDWETRATEIRWRPNKPDDFFFDLFDFSWRNPVMITEDLKHILMAMTYFVGHALPNELRRTSGLQRDRFRNALPVLYNASYIEVSRERFGNEYYTLHPLMHAFSRAALKSEEFRGFREGCSIRFVECFLEFARDAYEKNALDLLDEEYKNIVAAARVGAQLGSWDDVIDFRKYTAEFMRSRGYWVEYKEITELAVKACRASGKEELLAECLVRDLAWYCLRLEDVQTVRKFVNKGLYLFKKHRNRPGIAQAKRHLGKAFLLDGLDERYEPNKSAIRNFARAERYYKESLDIRQQLQEERGDQRLAIADLKLDFGRLYWLWGMKFEQDGRSQQDTILLDKALEKYKEANRISEEARREFERMSLSEGVAKARISKAWGNLGNATKEIASYMARNNEWDRAKRYASAAEQCYIKNLSLGEEILKKDEIAHALAGLAEVYRLMSNWTDSYMEKGTKRVFLEKAERNARRAHRLYEELVGPREQMEEKPGIPSKRTRDEVRTERLIDEISQLLTVLPDRRLSNSSELSNSADIIFGHPHSSGHIKDDGTQR